MDGRIKYFKYNEDDILEILTEYIAKNEGIENFHAKAVLLGSAQNDLRMICAITKDANNDSIVIMNNMSLEKIDRKMDFNGTHKPENYTCREKFLGPNPKDMF